MSTEDFEIGSKWRMRDGQVATIHKPMDSGFVVASWDQDGGRTSVFTPEGRYWFHKESELDLVEQILDEQA